MSSGFIKLFIFISMFVLNKSIIAQIYLPKGAVIVLNTNNEYLYDETRIFFNTGIFKSDDYKFEKKSDSLDSRWLVTACFNGECWNDLIDSGNFLKEYGFNDTTCFIAFHIETHGYNGKSVIKYNVYRKNNIADSANLEFNISYTNTSGINTNQNRESAFKMYPNPAKDKLTLQMNWVQDTKFKIQITNVLGERISNDYEGKTINGNWNNEIATSLLSNGVYFIQISTEGETTRYKFVVSH